MYLEAAEGGKKITATATCQTTLHFLATRLLALSLYSLLLLLLHFFNKLLHCFSKLDEIFAFFSNRNIFQNKRAKGYFQNEYI